MENVAMCCTEGAAVVHGRDEKKQFRQLLPNTLPTFGLTEFMPTVIKQALIIQIKKLFPFPTLH